MDALRWLFSVSVAFALVRGVQTFLLNAEGQPEFKMDSNFILLLVFGSFLIRFTHGYLRHFDKTYLDEPSKARGYQPLVDFVGIFTAAVLFIFMGFSIRSHQDFATYLLLLVIVDSVWLVYLSPERESRFLNWIIANFIFFATWACLYFIGWNDASFLVVSLGVVTIVHTVCDYCLPGNWLYYFDQELPQPLRAPSDWLGKGLGPLEQRIRDFISRKESESGSHG